MVIMVFHQRQSSFAMHASVAKHYFNGGSFPIGGSSEIANIN